MLLNIPVRDNAYDNGDNFILSFFYVLSVVKHRCVPIELAAMSKLPPKTRCKLNVEW